VTDAPRFAAFDDYVTDLFDLVDGPVARGLERARDAGLPEIEVSAPHARLLELLVRLSGARRVLEIGTLAGFSTTYLARGVGSGGEVVSLELDPDHAQVARANLADAGVGARVTVVVGDAHASLARLVAEGGEPFDAVFIDAEKAGYPAYLDAVLELSRPGTLIVADNVVWGGDVLDEGSDAPDVRGLREFNARAAEHPRLDATIVQSGSREGWDGLLLARVSGEPGDVHG
jgi:predicted O-methyltransferase YrrM